MPSTHENAINGLFESYLRQHGLQVRVGAAVVDSEGTTRWPDFELSNSGVFYGEGEFEDTAWLGFGQARDYSIAAGSSGAFLLLYPRALRRLPTGVQLSKVGPETILGQYRYDLAFIKPDRATDQKLGVPLQDIPRWLDERIHDLAPAQTDLNQTIKVLRQAVDALTAFLPDSVRDTNLFENLLGREPAQAAAVKATRQAAAYILVNQLMYYEILVGANPSSFSRIQPSAVRTPSDLTRLFPQDPEHEAVFGLDVASEFKSGATETVRQIVKVVEALSPEHVGGASLGKLFHELIPLDLRKHIAAFYTLEEAAAILAGLVVRTPNERVFDPACGSGTLLVAAYQRKRELERGSYARTPEAVHSQYLEKDLTGIDMMPFAAHMTALNLVLQAPEVVAPAPRVAIGDSTVLSPNDTLAPIQQVLPRSKVQRSLDDFHNASVPSLRRVRAGRVGIGRGQGAKPLKLESVDCVIMNPPFTRFQRLARFYEGYTEDIATSFKEYKGFINGRMPYCNYFIFLADRFLRPQGSSSAPLIGAVLPATVLRGDSSEGLRRFILNRYSVPYIIRRRRAANFSEDTQFTEILLILGKKAQVDQPTSYLIIDGLEGSLLDTIEAASPADNGPLDRLPRQSPAAVEVRRTNLMDLGTVNWYRPFSMAHGGLQALWESWRNRTLKQTLSGLASGLQSKDQSESGGPTFPSFSLNLGTEDEVRGDKWIIEGGARALQVRNTDSGDTRTIPHESVSPLFRRFRYRGFMDVSTLAEFVPSDSRGIPADFTALSRVRGRVHWPDWKSYLLSRTSNLLLVDRLDITAPGTRLVSYFSSPPRVWARVGTVIKGLPDEQARLLALWFNSTPGLIGYLAEQIPTRGGYMQLGKYIFSDFYVPDVRSLDPALMKRGQVVFDRVSSVECPRLLTQFARLSSDDCLSKRLKRTAEAALGGPLDDWGSGFKPREAIDDFAFDLMGLGVTKREELKKWIYSAMLEELVALWEIVQNGSDESTATLGAAD